MPESMVTIFYFESYFIATWMGEGGVEYINGVTFLDLMVGV